MKPEGLTLEELAHYAPIDAEVGAYVAEHAQEFFDDTENLYDPAGCYDDGWSAGSIDKREKLSEIFRERLVEARKKVGHNKPVDLDLYGLFTELIEHLDP